MAAAIFMHDRAVDPRVQRLRSEIERAGEALLEPGEITALCQSEISDDSKWNFIAGLAINEGWSFTFFPDDSVRFAKL